MKTFRIIGWIFILALFAYGSHLEKQNWDFELEQGGFLYMVREYAKHLRITITLIVASFITLYFVIIKTRRK